MEKIAECIREIQKLDFVEDAYLDSEMDENDFHLVIEVDPKKKDELWEDYFGH